MSDNRLSEAEIGLIESRVLPSDTAIWPEKKIVLRCHEVQALLATARDYARLEAENERWKEINRDELAETFRLMEALGVMDEVRDGKPCMDAMLAKIAAITAERDRLAEALRRISINTNDNGSGAADFARTALEARNG